MKIRVTFTLTHPRGKAAYIPNHYRKISQIDPRIKGFFSATVECGINHPAQNAILASRRQRTAASLQDGMTENICKAASLLKVINPRAAIMDKAATARSPKLRNFSMRGCLL